MVMITAQEIKDMAVDVMRDHKEFPPDIQIQQLQSAGWQSEPLKEFWLPPDGTTPSRPRRRYSAWKQMRKDAGL